MGGFHKIYCAISDSLVHDAGAVVAFQAALTPHIRSDHPGLKRHLPYGAASQYKNRCNSANICHHVEDYGIDCEWYVLPPHMTKMSAMASAVPSNEPRTAPARRGR